MRNEKLSSSARCESKEADSGSKQDISLNYLARTNLMWVFYSMQSNLEFLLRVHGKPMTKSMTEDLHVTQQVTAI